MSRQPPSDAFTRFTSTAPFSSSPPNPSQSSANSRFNANFSPNTSPLQQPPPTSPQPNETAAQRVARLRAAHRASQMKSQLSPVDRMISRGRNFADIAHRVTTYSLLAITGISTVIAAYGIVSLVSHNRRQKRAWIEREMDRLTEAQQAFLRGEANAEQLHLLEQERAGEEMVRKYAEEKKRRKEEGTWNRIKGTFGGFMGNGDMGVEDQSVDRRKQMRDLSQLVEEASQTQMQSTTPSSELRNAAVQAGPVQGVGLDEKGRPVPINKLERIRRDGEREVTARTGISGGPLDVLADNIADKAQSSGLGWWSWISGGGGGGGKTSSS